jgi:methylated-DNA-[protein]-cysteine S-methyltransferase
MNYCWFESPVGKLLLAGDSQGLQWIGFPQGKGHLDPDSDWVENDAFFVETRRQLSAYFAGELKEFSLTLAPHGTEFQLTVLEALQRIPFGETRSYGELAREIGRPNASRAVGAANGRNPLPIVIPCHRVIGSNGTLTGFGGGLEIKQFLLDLENPGQEQFDL